MLTQLWGKRNPALKLLGDNLPPTSSTARIRRDNSVGESVGWSISNALESKCPVLRHECSDQYNLNRTGTIGYAELGAATICILIKINDSSYLHVYLSRETTEMALLLL
ncbi:hypothetical protein D918_01167 [Trichuris suis]|nr:hypothetical protein D918_01167 [Trichuris suis]